MWAAAWLGQTWSIWPMPTSRGEYLFLGLGRDGYLNKYWAFFSFWSGLDFRVE